MPDQVEKIRPDRGFATDEDDVRNSDRPGLVQDADPLLGGELMIYPPARLRGWGSPRRGSASTWPRMSRPSFKARPRLMRKRRAIHSAASASLLPWTRCQAWAVALSFRWSTGEALTISRPRPSDSTRRCRRRGWAGGATRMQW